MLFTSAYPLWKEKILWIILIPWNVLTFLKLITWSVLVNASYVPENNVNSFNVGYSVLLCKLGPRILIVLIISFVSLLIFCLLFPSTNETGVLTSSTMIKDIFLLFCFCLIYIGNMLLDTYLELWYLPDRLLSLLLWNFLYLLQCFLPQSLLCLMLIYL